jgi:hypothetical protein
MAAVVVRAMQDVSAPRNSAVTAAERRDADEFLASPARCGAFLDHVGIDAEAFCQAYQRGGIAAARRALKDGRDAAAKARAA